MYVDAGFRTTMLRTIGQLLFFVKNHSRCSISCILWKTQDLQFWLSSGSTYARDLLKELENLTCAENQILSSLFILFTFIFTE